MWYFILSNAKQLLWDFSSADIYQLPTPACFSTCIIHKWLLTIFNNEKCVLFSSCFFFKIGRQSLLKLYGKRKPTIIEIIFTDWFFYKSYVPEVSLIKCFSKKFFWWLENVKWLNRFYVGFFEQLPFFPTYFFQPNFYCPSCFYCLVLSRMIQIKLL